MTSPGRVGRAYVEIVGDFDKFRAETTGKLNEAIREVSRNADFDPLEQKFGRSGEGAATAFEKAFTGGLRNKLKSAAPNIVEDFAKELESPRSKSRISKIGTIIGSIIAAFIGAELALVGGFDALKKFFGAIQGEAGSGAVFKALGQAASAAASQVAGLGISVAGLALKFYGITSIVVTLASQLAGLVGILGLLPGIIAVLVGILPPLVISMFNLAEAFQAMSDGDPEKIAEAMKKLAPSAQAFVKEIFTLKSELGDLQRNTQQALFGPIVGKLTEFFKTVGTGRITQGFVNVADALGRIIGGMIKLGSSKAFTNLGEILFGTSTDQGSIVRILDSLADGFGSLFRGLATAASATMPIVERIFRSFSGAFDRFGDWLEKVSNNGKLNAFIESALITGEQLWEILKNIFGLFLDIFRETDRGGQSFLEKINQAVLDLREWARSPEGKQALTDLISLANLFADALGLVVRLLERALELLRLLGLADAGGKLLTIPQYKNQLSGGKDERVHMAMGGVVNRPTFALVGESGREAVIPMNNPNRAAQVMSEAGLLPLAANMMAGSGTVVHVYLGTTEITDILDVRVQRGLAGVARSLGNRPRG